MKTKYKALLKLMILPFVLYSVATSGVADNMAVDESGARRPQNDNIAVMIILR